MTSSLSMSWWIVCLSFFGSEIGKIDKSEKELDLRGKEDGEHKWMRESENLPEDGRIRLGSTFIWFRSCTIFR